MIKPTSDAGGRRGWRQRLFAAMYAGQTPGEYEQKLDPYKRRLLGDLGGTVLEIGAGTGDNFPFYDRSIHWIGVEPNVYMHPHLLEAAERNGITGELRTGVAEHLPADDASIDAVVSTLVLCSVSHPDQVLSEIRRVLRPGGRFVFVEHVAAPPGSGLRLAQRLISPAWRFAADGCHPDRDTAASIERAGFSRVEIDAFDAPIGIASPHIAGYAIK